MAAPAWGSLPFAEQIEFFRRKTNLPTATWRDIWQAQHDTAFVVAGAQDADLLADLRSAVARAIEDGITLAVFRDDFEDLVARRGWTGWTGEGTAAGRAWRTRVIYETNLRASYQAGRHAQQRALADRRPYWRYRHNQTVVHPREEHLGWDGLILRADDPWWQVHYPPNGWGCRCRVESLAPRDLEQLGKSEPDDAPTPADNTDGIDPGWTYTPGATRQAELRAVADAKRAANGAGPLPTAPVVPAEPTTPISVSGDGVDILSPSARATALADRIAAEGYAAKTWTTETADGTRARVYVTRTLSRGRRQEMGYVEIMPDGTTTYSADRMGSTFRRWESEA